MKFLIQCSVCNKQTTYVDIDSPFSLCQRLNSLLICPCSHHETPGGFLRWVESWKRIDLPSDIKGFKGSIVGHPKIKPAAVEGRCLYRGIPFSAEFNPENSEPLSLVCLGNLFNLLKPEVEDQVLELCYPWED